MPKPIVIYLPVGAATWMQEQQLRQRYPTAEFVTRWQEGAIAWFDALK